ncbi:NACHT domain-containing NTPase [Nonomuraea sp. NEAU-A123]|uniref:NACHT domain-containing protein n=1 Tax=Nonomuraea sp. NEAU-A123 TaxID=2839649 RepID=UPI001BE45ECB|nr:NACHT domain-containing protein [Nonomuraea sp. NEAU-A123]MBT2232359.1 NACHT domain-containing protein [Nonomuraea sp. NEAU-A123]
MRSRRLRPKRSRWTVTAVVVAAGGGLLGLGLLLHLEGPTAADQGSSMLSASVAVLAAAASLIGWLRRRGEDRTATGAPDDDHGLLKERRLRFLAAKVSEQCDAEKRQRRLLDPLPMPVSWHTVGPPACDHWRVIRQGDGDAPLRLDGTLDDLHRVVTTSVPTRRLVVLGAPGSGKTSLIIRFALACLAAPASGTRPVPVILRLPTWDPTAQTLRQWITERLDQDYGVSGFTWIESLLPVLDGLDEMPARVRGTALRAINAAFTPGAPLIVTSRSGEYHEAVRDADVITGAAVIELDPLSPEEICAYLSDATRPDRVARWEKVFTRIRREPRGELAATLSVPLNLSLARLAYADGQGDPDQLLTLPSAAALRSYLLDQLLGVLYPDLPEATADERPWNGRDAHRWLAFLARHLHRRDIHDLAWWELAHAVPRRARVLIWAVAAGIVLALANTLVGLPWSLTAEDPATRAGQDLLWGLGGGLVVGAVNSLWTPLFPKIPKFRRFAIRRTGRSAGLRICLGLGSGLRRGLRGGVESGVPTMLIITLITCLTRRPPGVSSVSGYVQYSVSLLLIAFAFGFCCGFFYSFVTGLGAEFVTVFDDIDTERGATPAEVLRSDRSWTTTAALFGAVITAFMTAMFIPFMDGEPHDAWQLADRAVHVGVAGGLCAWLCTAYTQFLLALLSLAAAGRLPWRPMAFLQDAARRGALRQVGGVFQFRHALLRDRLALGGPGSGGGADR